MKKITATFKSAANKFGSIFHKLGARLKQNKVCAKIINAISAVASRIWAFAKKHKIIAVVICLVILLLVFSLISATVNKHKNSGNSIAILVERRDIEETIDGSTVVEPNDEYSITPMVSGEILDAPFEEGDYVNKGDLLYKVDAETVEKNIESADIAVAKAKKAYESAVNENNLTVRDYDSTASTVTSAEIAVEKAQQAYNDALEDYSDLNIKSTHTGLITNLYVSEGDNISTGTKLADVVDSSSLKTVIPFNTYDAENIRVGDAAALTLTNSGSVINGTVTDIADLSESGSGYTSFRRVTIEVQNPGAVSSGDTVTAMVGDIACSDIGTFEYITDTGITSSVSGKISSLYISEGSSVRSGQVIAALDADSVSSNVTSAKLTLDDAEQALERAKLQQKSSDASTDIKSDSLTSSVETAKLAYDDAVISRENLEKQLEDYNITAPISGTVVTKNMKKGDKIGSGSSSSSISSSAALSAASSSGSSSSGSSSSSSALAVIYDMSRLKCTLDVDELDVKKISLGQKVTITADASDKEYTGTVENIGVEGSVGSNGVTTYPVKIDIIDFDDALLPGMNIDAKIVISSAHNVLAAPVSSVNRGDTIYIKGDKTDDNDAAPEGYHTVEVVTGISDGSYIEISGSLSEGDEIYSNITSDDIMQQMQQMTNQPGAGMGGGEPPGGGGAPGGGGGR